MLSWCLPPPVVLALLVFPIVLIGLYSVDLQTNLIGVPTKFSTGELAATSCRPAPNPFWDRFKTSMGITLLVSVVDRAGRLPGRLLPGLRRRAAAATRCC